MRSWEFTFAYPKPPLSLNYRMHHMQAANLTKRIREETRAKTRNIPEVERCRVELFWYVNTRVRRDDENPVPTLKAMCDALVDNEIVPDDTHEFMVKMMPRIVYAPKKDKPACMVLRVTEIGVDDANPV